MVRDRRNPYAPSAADGQDGSYARPPGKFTLTEALGSSGKSNVAPKTAAVAAAGSGDKPETTDDANPALEPERASADARTKQAIGPAPAREAVAPPQEAPPPRAPVASGLPRLELGRRTDKP